MSHLKKVLTLRPFEADFLTELGRTYYLNGQYDRAREILESAENLPPFDPVRAFYLGQTRMKLGQLDRALWTLENLVGQRPDYYPAYYALGDVYSQMEKPGDAHYNLGFYYMNKGDLRNAVFHLTRARDSIKDAQKKERIEELLGEIPPLEQKKPE